MVSPNIITNLIDYLLLTLIGLLIIYTTNEITRHKTRNKKSKSEV